MGWTVTSTSYDSFEDEKRKTWKSPQWLLHNLIKGSCGHYYNTGLFIQLSLTVKTDQRSATESLECG